MMPDWGSPTGCRRGGEGMGDPTKHLAKVTDKTLSCSCKVCDTARDFTEGAQLTVPFSELRQERSRVPHNSESD